MRSKRSVGLFGAQESEVLLLCVVVAWRLGCDALQEFLESLWDATTARSAGAVFFGVFGVCLGMGVCRCLLCELLEIGM